MDELLQVDGFVNIIEPQTTNSTRIIPLAD